MLRGLMWPLAKRFVGGRGIPEVLKRADSLKNLGYGVILSSADEHVDPRDPERILKAEREYLELLRNLSPPDKIAIKLSQFGLTKAQSVAEKWPAIPHLLAVLDCACKKNIQVAFDAEYLTDRQFYCSFLASLWGNGFQNIERVIQAYGPSWDWEWFLNKCAEIPMPARICMGAYKSDPAAISFKTNYDAINYQYNCAVYKFLSRGIKVEIATGNEDRIKFWAPRIHRPSSAQFSMLLGIRPDLAKKLKSSGHPPYIYLLFGDHWFPYVKRRILENPGYLMMPFRQTVNY